MGASWQPPVLRADGTCGVAASDAVASISRSGVPVVPVAVRGSASNINVGGGGGLAVSQELLEVIEKPLAGLSVLVEFRVTPAANCRFCAIQQLPSASFLTV